MWKSNRRYLDVHVEDWWLLAADLPRSWVLTDYEVPVVCLYDSGGMIIGEGPLNAVDQIWRSNVHVLHPGTITNGQVVRGESIVRSFGLNAINVAMGDMVQLTLDVEWGRWT